MNKDTTHLRNEGMRIGGEVVFTDATVPVHYPYTGEVVGHVPAGDASHARRAFQIAAAYQPKLTRYERSRILQRAGELIGTRRDDLAKGLVLDLGICWQHAIYETKRAQDVYQFAAAQTLKDDGEIFSCDLTHNGKARKIYTMREPLRCVGAITPFNHPLNQVVHKVAPAIAAGAPIVLKPSEKTPLTAIRFAEILYECGLPGPMLSVVLGPTSEVADTIVRSDLVEALTFTGSTTVGRLIASTAGYKKLALELGGNSPLLVLDDADLDLAVRLAAEGAFRNSGQRCTAVKRILVDRRVIEPFTERFTRLATEYTCGDPTDPETRVGTVIDEPAAVELERVVLEAEAHGAKILLGGKRDGALMHPTVLRDVPRDAEIIRKESFGPLAPIVEVDGLKDAINLANSSDYGLSTAVVTQSLDRAIKVIKSVRTGTVNVNEVPGYRLERSPFGGVKASGLGVKEGVIEAAKWMGSVKTYSLPW